MKACAAGSLVGVVALAITTAGVACRDPVTPEVPPLTTATPASAPALAASEASASRARTPSEAASLEDSTAASLLAAGSDMEPPITASFLDAPGKIESPLCSRVLVAVAKGKVSAMGDVLAVGDVLVVSYPDPIKLEGNGLVIVARRDFDNATCGDIARPKLEKKLVRASAAADLRWAGGTMGAHLDVGQKLSPEVYLGRLEGTAAVAEHNHPASWEILAAVDASGTFVLNGTERRLGPKQIVMVPPAARHSWKPDPGSKLVAIQLYSPPGPEQRFIALAAAEKDAGARDAR